MLDSTHRGQIALEAVKLWHGEPASLQPVSDSENHVYSFTIAEKKLFLRLTSSEHRILEEIEAEVDFISYLVLQRDLNAGFEDFSEKEVFGQML